MAVHNNGNYGYLYDEHNLKLHRTYFQEMVRLIGIYVIYRSPKKDKHWTTYQEIDGNYNAPIVIGCIFNEHPDQRSLKKMGWVSELQTNESIINVGYDTPNLQVGSLIIIPSGIDNTQGRLFRITAISNIMIYPASITCVCVPEYYDEMPSTVVEETSHTSLQFLDEEEDNM